MDTIMKMRLCVAAVTLALLSGGIAAAGPAPDSKRLSQGKDYVADEQWTRAIAEFKAAADDRGEKNRDEALFWLAHSEHQSGDDASALQTIVRLEREYPKSPWVRLAHSVRVEIAQRLRRDDVLWWIATPPPAPPPSPVAPVAHPAVATQRPRAVPPSPPGPPPAPSTPPAIAPPATLPPSPWTALPPPAAEFWVGTQPGDQVIRIEALAALIDAHSERVIPLLKDIAFDRNSPDEARRALLVLARCQRPQAHDTVVEVAREGAEPVQIVAIRELGRMQDVNASGTLMQVYATSGATRVRRQIVTSLGERADNMSLFRIAKTEQDPGVRNTAIMTLGRIPTAREQLRVLYGQAPVDSREAVISALFTARDDDELIRIASTEKSPLLRQRARQQLRLLATPKAQKYLAENP